MLLIYLLDTKIRTRSPHTAVMLYASPFNAPSPFPISTLMERIHTSVHKVYKHYSVVIYRNS